MTTLGTAAREVMEWLAGHGWDACLIGGLAVQRWGEPRLTNDVDVTVIVTAGDEARFLDAALEAFRPRRQDARSFAMINRVLLVTAANNVPIDVALGATGFEIEAVARSSRWEVEAGCEVRTCSAEDLIVHKLVAGRPRDVADIEGIVARQGRRLDLDAIRRWVAAFAELKEDSDLGRPFESALAKMQRL